MPDFVSEMRADFAANAARWHALYASLADAESRQTLWDLVRYRLSGDIDFMRAYAWRPAEQYFDAVAAPEAGAVFVDAGGYDGDTTEAFITRYPDYRRAHIFEPSPANMTCAKARLAARGDIVFHESGVGAYAHVARFDPASGSASAMSESGAMEIQIATIDDAVGEPANFMKFDIEGEEFNALKGAARQIAEHAPTLAVAVYHRATDFWQIADWVLSVRGDYRLYLRHYTEGWAETVLYCVKR